MTDNEIIKALECCSNYNDCDKCNFEPKDNKKKTIGCCLEIMKNALDLINRQKEEIEGLKEIIEYKDICVEACEDIKAEAYKECIEKVKMEAENATYVYEPDRSQADNMVYHISNIRLNKILKELVDEDE